VRQYPAGEVRLLPDLGRIDYAEIPNPFARRTALVREYLMSLATGSLLRPFRFEAGLPASGTPH
jgi:hypothetical protein